MKGSGNLEFGQKVCKVWSRIVPVRIRTRDCDGILHIPNYKTLLKSIVSKYKSRFKLLDTYIYFFNYTHKLWATTNTWKMKSHLKYFINIHTQNRHIKYTIYFNCENCTKNSANEIVLC